MSGSWRDSAAPIIARVITDVGREDTPALRRALRDAYPFGARKWFPYKIWCDEIQRQLGTKPPLGTKQAPVDLMTHDLFAA